MSNFTKAIRQKIVREFATRHNGVYNPLLFLEEVKTQGKTHPAYEWFEWDTNAAVQAYQVEQARSFARDLRVIFKVEETVGPSSVRIRETSMPMVLSPTEGRNKGGGYVLTDPDNPDHIEEHCRQAALTLQQWLTRYEAALAHAKIKPVDIEKIIGKLEVAAQKKAAAVA